jgi:DNA primase
MPGIDYREARARVRLAEVLELVGFEARSGFGEQLRGPCPVHQSRTPTSRSFAAHLGKGMWHCFRCGAGGNVLDLWVAVIKLPFYAAVIDLYTRRGREVPSLPSRSSPRKRGTQTREQAMPQPCPGWSTQRARDKDKAFASNRNRDPRRPERRL